MVEALPQDYFLREHSAEFYVQEKMHEKLHFLSMFPTVDNKYGEFTSYYSEASAAKDLADGILSEPTPITEGVDFNEIETEDIKEKQGALKGSGFRVTYTDLIERQGKLTAQMVIKCSKAVSAMAIGIDNLISSALVKDAGCPAPDASSMTKWSDLTKIDPRDDTINIQSAYDADGFGYEVSDVYINKVEFTNLAKYMASQEYPYDIHEIKVDNVTYHNLGSAITAGSYVALDKTVPAAIIEKFVDPKYSVVRQAEIKSLKEGKELKDVPQSLINTREWKPEAKHDINVVDFWYEIACNVQEPHGIIAGSFKS